VSPAQAEARARRINQKRAGEAPLLAAMGVLPMVTASDVQAKQERNKAAAEAHHQEQQAWEASTLARMKQELSDRCSAEDVAAWAAQHRVGQPGYVSEYIGYAGALDRVRAGRPLVEAPVACGSDRPRQAVDVQTVSDLLKRSGGPVFNWQAADELKAPILDVIAAFCRLRDAGMATAAHGGGWRAA